MRVLEKQKVEGETSLSLITEYMSGLDRVIQLVEARWRLGFQVS